MKTAHILLLCIVAAALVSTVVCTNGIGPEDCCFEFYPRRIKKTLLKNYYLTDQRCPKAGIILVTQNSRHICVDPALSWVEVILKYLDEKTF